MDAHASIGRPEEPSAKSRAAAVPSVLGGGSMRRHDEKRDALGETFALDAPWEGTPERHLHRADPRNGAEHGESSTPSRSSCAVRFSRGHEFPGQPVQITREHLAERDGTGPVELQEAARLMHDPHEVGMGIEELEVSHGQGPNPFIGRSRMARASAHVGGQGVGCLLEHRLEQCFLVGKVAIQGAFGDPCVTRKILNGGFVEAELSKQSPARSEQLGAGRLLAKFTPASAGGVRSGRR